ncbi:MAG TPA: alpha/beta fold hydrolase [Actinocrinis sp.]|nr:alpha/beta fold hydrolase [Actinocrinis sp.]
MTATAELNSEGSATAAPHNWQPPSPGPLPRGTVILLPGRGEHGGVYERFGRRLASDAYAVHALDVTSDDDLGVIAKQVTAISAHAVTPVILAGSDTGALQALALAAGGAVTVDGLLLAGLPSRDSGSDSDAGLDLSDDADWDEELAARTSCPAHRGRLTDDPRFAKGSLHDPIPSQLDLSSPSLEFDAVRAPALILHGGADPVAPVQTARVVAARLPRAELAVTEDGRHDVLNDATHRTVAAQVVQWLERLRNGSQLTPIIVVEDVVPASGGAAALVAN